MVITGQVSRVAILGSTGSIGRSTLDVVAASGGTLEVVALTAHHNCELLEQQARRFRPRWIVVTDSARASEESWSRIPPGTELLTGSEGLRTVVADKDVDVVVNAIVGRAGLEGTLLAIEAGKHVALANKETLVIAGQLVMQLAAKAGARITPIDSEHSAVLQACASGRRDEIRRIVLTASGGPFLRHSLEQLRHVTVSEALHHPTWDMGRKITVDSATMMNKALEIIEARWLFDLQPEQIDVVIHPQSVVHSMVEFVDGSVIAQLSPPDMKLPIQYALTYPARRESCAAKLDFSSTLHLDFEPPEPDRFPALALGAEVAKRGGTAGAVLNAANEAAVDRFLGGELGFSEIVPACREILDHHNFDPRPSLAELLAADRWARQEVARWICT